MSKFNAFDTSRIGDVFEQIVENGRLNVVLPNLNKNEKTAILIDGNNLFCTLSRLGFYVDYAKLKKVFADRTFLDSIHMAVAVNPDNPTQDTWINHLRTDLGYRVKSKLIKHINDGNSRKGNMDVEFTISAMRLHESVEHVILVSGDGDFAPLARELKSAGKRVSVLGSTVCVPNTMSRELRDEADTFYELNDLRSFIEDPTKTERQSDRQGSETLSDGVQQTPL